MRTLVVEDEPEFAAVIARVLDRSGFAVDVAASAAAGQLLLDTRDYDVVLLDRALRDGSGDDLCRRLVQRGTSAKVLMLTARDAIADRVAGLELGADDYVVKPVAMAELVARVRALARRRGEARHAPLRHRDLVFDPGSRLARRSPARAQPQGARGAGGAAAG